MIDGECISCEVAIRWMSLDLSDEKSTLVQLGAIKQQAITWTNVASDLCRHIMSPGHNELISDFSALSHYKWNNPEGYGKMGRHRATINIRKQKPCAQLLGNTVCRLNVYSCYCNVPAPATPLVFEPGLIVLTLKVASKRSNQRVRPANERLASQLDCHIIIRKF